MIEFEKIQEKLARLPVKQQKICWLLSRGFSQHRTGQEVGLTQPRISQMLHDPEYLAFQETVDSLTRYLGKLGAAESLRLVRQAVAQFQDPETGELDLSNTNLLQWLREKNLLEGTTEDTTKVRVVFDEPISMSELIKNLS